MGLGVTSVIEVGSFSGPHDGPLEVGSGVAKSWTGSVGIKLGNPNSVVGFCVGLGIVANVGPGDGTDDGPGIRSSDGPGVGSRDGPDVGPGVGPLSCYQRCRTHGWYI